MPVGIMQVMNAAYAQVSYTNKESGYSFIVPGKTEEYPVQCSIERDDTLPWYNARSTQKHIDIKVGNAAFRLSERDAQFYVEWEAASGCVGKGIGTMYNGGRYMLYFLGNYPRNGTRELAFEIHDHSKINEENFLYQDLFDLRLPLYIVTTTVPIKI